jgi:hypothetical protein
MKCVVREGISRIFTKYKCTLTGGLFLKLSHERVSRTSYKLETVAMGYELFSTIMLHRNPVAVINSFLNFIFEIISEMHFLPMRFFMILD